MAANGFGVAQVEGDVGVGVGDGGTGAGEGAGAGAGAGEVLPPGTGIPGGSQPPL
jgi:hypothetical protein